MVYFNCVQCAICKNYMMLTYEFFGHQYLFISDVWNYFVENIYLSVVRWSLQEKLKVFEIDYWWITCMFH